MAPASTVELHPGEPLRVAARRVIAARSADLDGIAPGAVGSSDPEALHDVRVALRRLTSALDVFADGLEEEPRRRARRMLKRDSEPLGRARDLDVQIALVRRFLKAARTSEQAGIAHVLAVLSEERAEAEGELKPAMASLADPELQAALAEVSAGVKAEPRQGLAPRHEARRSGASHRKATGRRPARVRCGRARSVQRARAARPAHRREAPALHARGAGGVLGPAAAVVQDEARALQDLLGEVHDCDVLAPRLEPELAHARRRRCARGGGARRGRPGRPPRVAARRSRAGPCATASRRSRSASRRGARCSTSSSWCAGKRCSRAALR